MFPRSFAVLTGGALAALLLSACAMTPRSESQPVDAADRHEADFAASAQASFDKIDTDRNSAIDRQEWDVFLQGYLARQIAAIDQKFADADTNHDGRLDRTEAAADSELAAHFDEIDTDQDGYLSQDEIRAAIRAKMWQELDAAE